MWMDPSLPGPHARSAGSCHSSDAAGCRCFFCFWTRRQLACCCVHVVTSDPFLASRFLSAAPFFRVGLMKTRHLNPNLRLAASAYFTVATVFRNLISSSGSGAPLRRVWRPTNGSLAAVPFDCFYAQEQQTGDLLGRISLGDQLQDFSLTAGHCRSSLGFGGEIAIAPLTQ